MGMLTALVCFLFGMVTAVGIILILQKERVFRGAKSLRGFTASINQYFCERGELQKERDALKSEVEKLHAEIVELRQSTMQLAKECDVMEVAWSPTQFNLQSTKRVDANETIIYGRGREWVYLYTFPAHEQLAHERRQKHFPMKLGMSTQDDVVTRVDQQVSGNSTAISEMAVIRLVFRVNDSRDCESWMHEYLKRNGRQVSGSIGVEWFNTCAVEVEQLFRSYVMQKNRANVPVAMAPMASASREIRETDGN